MARLTAASSVGSKRASGCGTISRMLGMSAAITAAPCARPSATGRPKPSASDGKTTSAHERYIASSAALGTVPGNRTSSPMRRRAASRASHCPSGMSSAWPVTTSWCAARTAAGSRPNARSRRAEFLRGSLPSGAKTKPSRRPARCGAPRTGVGVRRTGRHDRCRADRMDALGAQPEEVDGVVGDSLRDREHPVRLAEQLEPRGEHAAVVVVQ